MAAAAAPGVYTRQVRTAAGMVDVSVGDYDRNLIENKRVRIVKGRPRVYHEDGTSRDLILLVADRMYHTVSTRYQFSPINGDPCDLRGDNVSRSYARTGLPVGDQHHFY